MEGGEAARGEERSDSRIGMAFCDLACGARPMKSTARGLAPRISRNLSVLITFSSVPLSLDRIHA